MPDYTEFLGLLKKDPVADAADTFNIQTMLNDNWDKIDAAVNGKAQIAMGAYIGTGEFGEASPNTLSFGFAPILIMFFNDDGSYMDVGGSTSTTPTNGMAFNPQLLDTKYSKGPPIYEKSGTQSTMSKRSADGRTVSWYTTGSYASYQYNAANTTYRYIALG